MVDVRDAMRAYWDAAIYCTPGEAYNIGGNKIITVGEFLELLKFHANVEIPSEQDESLLRPSDVTLQIPSTDKFISATNWQPKYSFDDSVSFLLDYCRKAVSKEIVQS
jgi:nucleoside-diphosphate-sugar epimerase